jgi:hypothetical protein
MLSQRGQNIAMVTRNNADMMGKTILDPTLEALDQIKVVGYFHQSIVTQKVPLRSQRFT